MNNLMLRTVITWLLIACPLWWTTGCYSFVEITRIDTAEQGKHDLEITTKGHRVYVLSEWSVDSMGTIRGKTNSDNPSYRVPERWDPAASISGEPKYVETPLCVPADSVSTMRAEQLNTAQTVLASLGIVAGATPIVEIIVLASFHGLGGGQMSIPMDLGF
jgi:hypothetical protein